MKLARVRVDDGVWLARLDGDELVLLAAESDHPSADVLREALALGLDLAGAGVRSVPASDARTLTPVVRPSKVLAVGLNYADHAKETGMEPPPAPLLFAKAPSSIVGDGDAIRFRGDQSTQVDYEAELAIVMGRAGNVFGFTVCNDVSARDLQFADGQWMRAKSIDSFCPLGPCIVTADDRAVADPQRLAIRCTVNGEVMQDSSTAEMIFGVEEIVAYASRFFSFEAGDVIATGTPAGVGFTRRPPRFLADGDEVVCSVEGVGELRNPVVVYSD